MIFAKPAHSSRNIKDDSPEKKLDYTHDKGENKSAAFTKQWIDCNLC